MPKYNFVQHICELARANNENGLTRLYLSGVSINVRCGNYPAVTILAKEGNRPAVQLLIQKFNVRPYDAVRGYAIGGHTNWVNEWLLKGVNKNAALLGYAQSKNPEADNFVTKDNQDLAVFAHALAGNKEKVFPLLEKGAERLQAVLGFAQGGHVNEALFFCDSIITKIAAMGAFVFGRNFLAAEKLADEGISADSLIQAYAECGDDEEVHRTILTRGYIHKPPSGYGDDHTKQLCDTCIIKSALIGYARGGHIHNVNKFYQAIYSNADEIAEAYLLNGHIGEQQNTLHVMLFTEDELLRKAILNTAKKANSSLDIGFLMNALYCEFPKALLIPKLEIDLNPLSTFLRKSNFYTKEDKAHEAFQNVALDQISPSLAWIILGLELSSGNNYKFPFDIYILITSYVIGLSNEQTKSIVKTANELIYTGAKNNLNIKHTLFPFHSEQMGSEQHQLEIKYKNRIKIFC